MGPSARAYAIFTTAIRGAADLTRGVGDRSDLCAFGIVSRQDVKSFGFAATTQCTKQAFLPGEEVI